MKMNLQVSTEFWHSVLMEKQCLALTQCLPKTYYVFAQTNFLPLRMDSIRGSGSILLACSQVCLVWCASSDTYSEFRTVLLVLLKKQQQKTRLKM